MKSQTIAAISTPFGSGGIGILRLSGSRSVNIAASLFQKTTKSEQSNTGRQEKPFASHRFYHGHVLDPDTQEIIDEVLVVAMLAPKSYTREDVVEIHSHSGVVVLRKIYEKVLSAGAVLAEPGEFTKRAFLNGRIDLTQAEAVADIINAKTGTALRIANQQLSGGLKEKIVSIREVLIGIRVLLEATIDFPEDVKEAPESKTIVQDIERGVLQGIEELLKDYRQGHFYREGVKMAVIGRPNVGKSSLMNRLIDRDRAIVTAVPGTTRDVIEELFHINGLPLVIMDTAGLHEALGEVEKIGIEKTRQSITDADFILFLVDSSEPLYQEDLAIYHEIADKKHLVVQNKIDLLPSSSGSNLPEAWRQKPCVSISALKGTGIQELRHMIWTTIAGDTGVNREIGIVPNLRHKNGLEQCLVAAKRARQAMLEAMPAEIIATDIMDAIDSLGTVVGDHCEQDILDEIFSRFCIGK
jgi:tRNA modification GTPase